MSCHWCGTTNDVEPSTFDTPIGAFRVPACETCAYDPPSLSWSTAADLCIRYPADPAPDDDPENWA